MNYNSGSSSPPQSLGLQLRVAIGRNQIQRWVGDYSALYFADGANVQDTYFELVDYSVWASNPQETYQRLVVSCTGPVLFQAVKADNTNIEFTINRMAVLDFEIKTFRITNQGSEKVRGNLHYVSNRQGQPTFVPPPV